MPLEQGPRDMQALIFDCEGRASIPSATDTAWPSMRSSARSDWRRNGRWTATFDPIDEPADIVLKSSDTDDFHCDHSHITGKPAVVNTVVLPPEGVTVKGLKVKPFPATECLTFGDQSE
jgi:hypothetical protein